MSHGILLQLVFGTSVMRGPQYRDVLYKEIPYHVDFLIEHHTCSHIHMYTYRSRGVGYCKSVLFALHYYSPLRKGRNHVLNMDDDSRYEPKVLY